MSNSSGIITAPVIHDKYNGDIQQVLGVYTDDLEELCKSDAVNKWSKYKPIKIAGDPSETEWDGTNHTWLVSATWWKGIAKAGRLQYTCGLTINCYTDDRSGFKSAVDNGNVGWEREKPTGGTYLYRQLDFAEYRHHAPALLDSCECPDEVKPSGKFSVIFRGNAQSSRFLLGLNDIFENSAQNKIWFFGVVCYSGSTWKAEVNSRIPIGQAGQLIDNVSYMWDEVKLTAPAATGTYKLYPCIMYASNFDNNPTGSLDNQSTPVTQTFVPLPLAGFSPITLTVTNQGATAEWLTADVNFYIAWTDMSMTNIDIANSELRIVVTSTAGEDVPSGTRTNTAYMKLGNVQFSGFPQQSETFTYSGTSNNPHKWNDGTLVLTYANFNGVGAQAKQQNMYEAIQQAQNANAYMVINQLVGSSQNPNNTSVPVTVRIGIRTKSYGNVID